MAADPRPVLHICTTCRQAGKEASSDEMADGATLLAALENRTGADGPVRLNPVSCLANCDQGCSAALGQKGKWTYLLGYLNEGLAADLLSYAEVFAASKSGVVMPSKRPESLKDLVIARVPAHPDELADTTSETLKAAS